MYVIFITVNGSTLNLLEMFYCFNIKFCLAASGYIIFIYLTSFVVIKLCNCIEDLLVAVGGISEDSREGQNM
jgi:hypothetical protein